MCQLHVLLRQPFGKGPQFSYCSNAFECSSSSCSVGNLGHWLAREIKDIKRMQKRTNSPLSVLDVANSSS